MASFLQKLQGGQGSPLPQPEHLGCIRVVVVGNSNVGKTALTELIATGKPPRSTRSTVGCNVSVTLFEESVGAGDDADDTIGTGMGANGAAAHLLNGGTAAAAAGLGGPMPPRHKFFVELWDVSGHPSYADMRRIFYRGINGVVLVHDLTSRGSLRRLPKWAAEVASEGSFIAPLPDDVAARNIGGLPVPVLVIGNKADRLSASGTAHSPTSASTTCGPFTSGNSSSLQQLCGSWLRRRRAPAREASEASLSDLHAVKGLHASAAAGQLDMGAVRAFFLALWARRYRQSGRLGSNSQLYVADVAEGPRRNGATNALSPLGTSMDRRLDDDWV